MDGQALAHVLSPMERDRFERDGFLIVENALTADMVAAADRRTHPAAAWARSASSNSCDL